MRPRPFLLLTARRTLVPALALVASVTGCTWYRIARWRDPSPDQPQRIFAQSPVAHATAPFAFPRPAAPRRDLDTVSVRDVDGRMVPLATYLENRRIRAFLVVRNDTMLYERYSGTLADTGLWNAYSVTKSVTSILLGAALRRGAVQSLDDPVTKYLPEVSNSRDYQGLTLRHLLGMRSGFDYSRTNGSLWHDLRSSDAHFFYTTDRTRSVLSQHRKDPPGARWAYKDSDTDLLALVLVRATGKSLARQLEESVWTRIGTEHAASFNLDHRDGLEDGAAGLNAIARDYARLGRLMLHDGWWNGTPVLDSAWVRATTQLDTMRTEPEVLNWYRMQHTGFWWIPMHNWAAERDFFADGSRGQRIYVHRASNTIVVQLADDSNQEFPFRRVVHYLSGTPYRYPAGIASQTLRAARLSADSGANALESLLAAEQRDPAGYTVNEAALVAVVELLHKEGKSTAAMALLRAGGARYGSSCQWRALMSKAGLLQPAGEANVPPPCTSP